MKNTKMIAGVFAAMLFIACFTANSSFAQTKSKMTMMKDCCMMKDGKMVQMKDGKMMPMDKDLKMTNGTVCMVNGECVMKDGTKMKMKEGQCMDMAGTLDQCKMMSKSTKTTKTVTKMNSKNRATAAVYTCPMHPEIISDKPGKCPKCGMELVKKE